MPIPETLTWLLILIAFSQAACSDRITDKGKRQLRWAAQLIAQDSYSQAKAELGKFLQANPTGPEASEAHYMLGLCAVYADQPEQAQNDFSSALPAADLPILRHYIRLSLANLAFERQDYRQACEYYGSYLDQLPRRPPFDLAYYRYGLALQTTGQWKQADIQFARFTYFSPQAQLAHQARQLFGKTHYALEIGRFSSFEQAAMQRTALEQLPEKTYWSLYWTDQGWAYVNLYGQFADLTKAKEALDILKPRIDQARIVPASSLGRRGS